MRTEYQSQHAKLSAHKFLAAMQDRTALPILTVMLVLLGSGCDARKVLEKNGARGERPSQDTGQQANSTKSTTDPVSTDSETHEPGSAEYWDACLMQKSKIGYIHTTIRDVQRDGQALRRLESHLRMAVQRFGQSSQQDVRLTSYETPQGEVVAFTSETTFGSTPTVVSGQIVGDKLVIEGAVASKAIQLPWRPEYRGFFGVEESFEQSPMKPGERRSLQMLQPILNQVAAVDLSAREEELTPLMAGSARLLRIDATIRLPDAQAMEGTYWTDHQGNVIKNRAMELECYRTTRALAESSTNEPPIDLGFDLFVKADPPLKAGHAARRARYQVELKQGDPAQVFASGATQKTTSIGPHTAEVTVIESRPDVEAEALAAEAPPTDEDRSSSSLVESDDPRIVAMAADAASGHVAPAEVAKALEAYVHRAITTKGFSKVFSSAAEVAESREGDCTEHAVLLVALARARGIPARAALGLEYVQRQQAFGFHMWTEMFLNGRWVPLDATLGRGRVGATHLKLGQSSLNGPAAYSSFLPVWRVLGQLKIKVLEEE